MSDMPYCMAHLVGIKKCDCAMCKRSRKIHRENSLLVWGCVLAFLLVSCVAFFSKGAECKPPNNCFGACIIGTSCGNGPGCGCVPNLPGSPLGTCVGGG